MTHSSLSRAGAGFPFGYTVVNPLTPNASSDAPSCGIEFAILRLKAGETYSEECELEAVWVLLSGQVQAQYTTQLAKGGWQSQRHSLFEENPSSLHLPPRSELAITARDGEIELAVAKTRNCNSFRPRCFEPKELTTEYRGEGMAQGACLREVRQIFDKKNAPESNLVIGEVVNYPGRWSSFPPHHHSQPEIYHYRFTQPQGYGHAELGDEVLKVRSGDTVLIEGGLDHGQVSAPGYGMYYLWVIRHLPGDPYTGFQYADEHKWILDPKNQGWTPQRRPAP